MAAPENLRSARARVIDDASRGGVAFGKVLSDVLDDAFAELLMGVDVQARWTLVALGSYARRELCPGSDIDVMFLHDGRVPVADAVAGLWYPLWDAGFVLGHSTRTVKEALALADSDLAALTALLETRVVGGDAGLGDELDGHARRLIQRRRKRVVDALADAAAARADRPGPVAEMLEPNLKDGAGGLRDIEALAWAGWALGAGGSATLVERGYLQPGDLEKLAAAKDVLLRARVELHRVTGGRSDLLTLQEQDAVAAALGAADADALVREVAAAARTVSWIASDVWSRLRAAQRGPGGRLARRDRPLADGVVLRDGRVQIAPDATVDAALVLRAATAAADRETDIDRAHLERFRAEMPDPRWGEEERAAFVELLRSGRRAVPVFEALDHVGVLARLLPEGGNVRSLPQRNAYHRFTVDRHLLEAVAECAALLTEPGLEGDIARRARADLLLLGALLHDVGKGRPGDHSAAGAEIARAVGRRIGLEDADVETLVWLVRNHLLLAQTATRRDLSEETAVTRFGRAVGDVVRLDLLYALTVGDSRATGPAAWSPTKAALVRELFIKTDALLERGVVISPLAAERRDALAELIGTDSAEAFLDAMPAAYTTAFDPDVAAHHRALLDAGFLAVEWADLGDGRLECTVAAPDRTGLLSTVAGVLALSGFDIRDATGYSHRAGMAVEVFTGVDRFGRLADGEGRDEVVATLDEALRGKLPLEERLRDRAARYRRPAQRADAEGVDVRVDVEASDFATVIEVHAPDEVGLLARVTAVFAELDLDVSLAKVATLGDRVVDVFYVRDATGAKITDRTVLEQLRTALLDRLAGDLAPT
ncbi:MAG TPA: [protein-PII] uridylyltransferase [Acidimicrobiia bacterium]|nr:[protein-PII] uridylyltransferase [Acidimicrobiia bacterium]